MNTIKNFIGTLSGNDKAVTNAAFKDLIMTKVNTVLDIKKVELTSDIFNKQVTMKLSESADEAYKSVLEQEMSNPRFVASQQTIAAGLTLVQAQALNDIIMQWHNYGGNLQQLLRGFYQKVYVSGNNPANPVMQKALAYVLDKLQ